MSRIEWHPLVKEARFPSNSRRPVKPNSYGPELIPASSTPREK